MNIVNSSQSVSKNQASLEERVKSLKISSSPETQSMPKSTIFAWGLCFIMMIVAGLMTWRSYKMTPTGSDSVQQKLPSQINKSSGTKIAPANHNLHFATFHNCNNGIGGSKINTDDFFFSHLSSPRKDSNKIVRKCKIVSKLFAQAKQLFANIAILHKIMALKFTYT